MRQIPRLLEINDRPVNRVDLLLGLRGKDPELMSRTQQVRLSDWIVSRSTSGCYVG